MESVIVLRRGLLSLVNSVSTIDRIHKWRLINYSFVFMLIILTSLVSTNKIQKISIKTEE